VEPNDASTYTQVRSKTDISLLDVAGSRPVGGIAVSLGRVLVTTQVLAYEERHTEDHRFIRRVPLEMEPSVLDTTALWWAFGADLVDAAGIGSAELPGALHAAEHTGIGILPLFALCDRWDLGGVSTPWLDETAAATVVIHDAHPGGAGVAPMAFERSEAHLRSTLEVLQTCRCSTGCPSCVQSPKCGSGNEPLDKAAATTLLSYALNADVRPAAEFSLPLEPSGVR
jgi:DEAD/DEAH box helicase domain-containing protein